MSTPTGRRLTKALLDYAFEHGVMLINTCSGALSTVMTEREVDTLAEVLLGGFRQLEGGGLVPYTATSIGLWHRRHRSASAVTCSRV